MVCSLPSMTITVRRFKPCFRSVERVNRTTNRLSVNPAEPMINRIPNQLREYNSAVLVPATGRLMNPATTARANVDGLVYIASSEHEGYQGSYGQGR